MPYPSLGLFFATCSKRTSEETELKITEYGFVLVLPPCCLFPPSVLLLFCLLFLCFLSQLQTIRAVCLGTQWLCNARLVPALPLGCTACAASCQAGAAAHKEGSINTFLILCSLCSSLPPYSVRTSLLVLSCLQKSRTGCHQEAASAYLN